MKTKYYVGAWVWNPIKGTHEYKVVVPDNKDFDFVKGEYEKLEISEDMPQVEICSDDGEENVGIAVKDFIAEEWYI